MAQKVRQELILTNSTNTASSSNFVNLVTTDYSNATFYFEVVGRVASGTMTVALRQLGTTTNDATLTFTETTYTRKRVAFTPVTGTLSYFLFISGGTTPSVAIGRIVILQNSSTTLAKTKTSIEIGNQELTKTNTTAAPLNFPKYWKYTSANWYDSTSFVAEVVWQHSSTMSNATIILEEDNGSFASWTTKVTIVNAATGGGGITRSSIAFTPTNGRNYRITARCASATYNYSIYSARILARIDTSSPITAVTKVSTSDPVISVGYSNITTLTSTRIALFESGTSKQLATYDWSGTAWVLVGTPLTISTSANGIIGFCTLTSSTVALIDTGTKELRTYSFNGSTWSQVGTGLSINVGWCTMSALDSTTVALAEGTNILQLRTYSWNGSTWSQVGSGFTLASSNMWSGSLTTTTFAMYTTAIGLATFSWNGSTWSQVGSATAPAVGGTNWMCSISSTRVVLIPNSTATLYFYDFNGSTWTLVSSIAYAGSGLVNTASSYLGSGLLALCAVSSGAALQGATITFAASLNLKMESEYLMLNTADIGTGVQGRQTLYDSTEWDKGSGTQSFFHIMDSDNASNSAKLTVPPATDITSSTITGINRQTSAALTLTTGTDITTNIINTTGSVNSSRILTTYSYLGGPVRIPRPPGTIGHPFML